MLPITLARGFFNKFLDTSFLEQLSTAAGLQMSSNQPVMLRPYRAQEGISGEIEANFIPGSRRSVPVVVVARNWQTGFLENWAVCQVRPSYSRTIEDLSHMGLRTASWVSPLVGIALALVLVYAERLTRLDSAESTHCGCDRWIESRRAPGRERRFLGQSRGS